MTSGKKSGGGKLSRSEIVQVRLNPQTRYLADLAARKQRRTLSSYIEWVISIMINDLKHGISKALQETWSVHEMERLVALKAKYPYLLTFDEEQLLKKESKND